jgi:cytochrome P450
VSRYEDIEAVLKDDRHFTVDFRKLLGNEQAHFLRPEDRMAGVINNHLLTRDGEDHRRLRALVSEAFTPQRIREMRPRIQSIANRLLDQLVNKGNWNIDLSPSSIPWPRFPSPEMSNLRGKVRWQAA